jgi:hypothetical protein
VPSDPQPWILSRDQSSTAKVTCKVKRTGIRPKIVVAADGRGVVSHVGGRLLTDLADATGLSEMVSEALLPLRQRAPDAGSAPHPTGR